MSIDVELPSLGESVFEGTVARWLVSEGEMVEVDQPIVEVTTDKVDAEIPAPAAGMIEEIVAGEGTVVEVGGVLARIDPDAKADSVAADVSAKVPAAPAAPEPLPTRDDTVSPAPGEGREDEEVAATPVARRIAEEAAIDLREVRGTGSGGRVTKEDVLRHGGAGAPPSTDEGATGHGSPLASASGGREGTPPPRPPVPSSPPLRSARHRFGYELQPGDRVIPMSPMRRIIAEHMVYSKRTSPHVGTVAEADLTRVVRFRKRHKDAFVETHGVPLTFLPFVVHATVRALREFPALNSSVVEDAIVEKRHIHIGVATETEKGLVVPVIRDADRLSLAGIAMAIHDLSSRAREKRLSADDLRGGTFTVSNPGRRGNLYGFAIINQPQVGILRMGEIAKRPVVRSLEGEDAIVIRTMMYLALSYDHRAVDGAPANGFLYRIREILEACEFEI